MAGLSSISGLVAGFDTKGAVDELLAAQRLQIDSLKLKQDAETQKQDAYASLNVALLDLKNTATNLSDASTFFNYTAQLTSNNASVPASSLVDISGSNAINAGSHSLVVQQLATAQREASSAAVLTSSGTAANSDTQALGLSGSFSINGVNINVQASDSILDIASSINQANSGSQATGVGASVIKSASNDYRLVLTSDTTGSTGFTLAGTDLDAGGALAALNLGASGQANARQTLQSAQDAIISIDGISVTRDSNSISDAISGLTLDLKQADPSVTISVDIGVDKEGVRASVQQFVDQYNAVQDFINAQFAFDAETGTGGVLAGDPLLTNIQRSLSDSLLQSVPGLASDRDSLVKIGIEPDARGHLSINSNLFDQFLNSDVNAIRDVFVANGASSNDLLTYITSGSATPSGSYSVDISQAAARASVVGTADLVATPLASAETVTVTMNHGAQAIINLAAGSGQQAVIDALNAEFASTYNEVHQLSTALMAGASPANGSNTFSDLGLGVAAGDSISISGTSRSGAAISATYTVLDPAVDTLGDLLSAINTAFSSQATASIDAQGHILLSDNLDGSSQISLNLTANNEGGGSLAFGTDTIVTEGRGALALTAAARGNGVEIRTTQYGSAYGFSISQSLDGLGIADQSVAGTDVAGTINGLAATGSGQILTGSAGAVDGLVLMYAGNATGAAGDLTLGLGIGAQYKSSLDLYANPVVGLINGQIQASQGIYDTLSARIDDLERQMSLKAEQLTRSFAAMESAMNLFQSTGSFLTNQINAMNKSNK